MSVFDRVAKIYISKDLNALKKTLKPQNYAEDIISDAFEVVLKKNVELLNEIEKKGKLLNYICSCIFLKQKEYGCYGQRSNTVVKRTFLLGGLDDFNSLQKLQNLSNEINPNEELKLNLAMENFKKLNEFESNLIGLYIEFGSLNKVAKLIGCSKSEVYQNVSIIKNKLKSKKI